MKKIIVVTLCLIQFYVYANDAVLRVIPLQNREASELQSVIAPFLENSDVIVANGNRLIVKTTEERLPSILALIKKLDNSLANLVISVVQSRTHTARDLNSSATLTAHLPIRRNPSPHGYLQGHFGNTLELSDNENTQKIRTLEGKAALIKVGQIYPVQNISLFVSGYGFPAVSTNTRFFETSTGFAVVPRLSSDQDVFLDISPWSEQMGQNGIIQSQSALTTIRTQLGKWVEIGSVNKAADEQQQGFLNHNRRTSQSTIRIILKVDKIQ